MTGIDPARPAGKAMGITPLTSAYAGHSAYLPVRE